MMHKTPIANRLHIGIFGRRNVGKSSFINALTGQSIAIVSDIPGTTTDPVYKTIEILPEPGPCVIIDTAGLDDIGELGNLRKEKTLKVLGKTDIAILLIDSTLGLHDFEKEIIKTINSKNIPLILVLNKIDLIEDPSQINIREKLPLFIVSSKTFKGIDKLKSELKKYVKDDKEDLNLVKGFVNKGDTVVLVIPIDSAMPKGRLILPEVQTLRAILDEDAHAVVCKEYELEKTLSKLSAKPDLVITDSQVYHIVKDIIPEDIRLTSFSMLFARYKGNFRTYIDGANTINSLKTGDNILITEACTHHPQPQDIGRKKIPDILQKKVCGKLKFDYAVASDFPSDIKKYSLIIMCGSCMINKTQVQNRITAAIENNIPITNYGIIFAKANGIFDRTSWLLDYS